MDLTYHHLNSRTPDAAFLFRFHLTTGMNPTILVDPGPGTDVSEAMGDDDYLAGVLLTHLHRDHCGSLPSNVEPGVRIYTSETNRQLIEETFVAQDSSIPDAPDWGQSGVDRAMQSPDGWAEITEDIHIRLVPVGHALGATGFIIRFPADGEWVHLFVAGDVSFHSVGGTQPAPRRLPVSPEIMLVNAPPNAMEQEATLTPALKSILEVLSRDQTVMVASNALTSIQFALLLEEIMAKSEAVDERRIHITEIAGQMFQVLGCESEMVQAATDYRTTASELSHGEIVLSGPADLQSGGAAEMHQVVTEMGGETVQLRATEGRQAANTDDIGTTYEYSAHATGEQLVRYIRGVSPVHAILGHGGDERVMDDLTNCFVWTGPTTEKRTLYTDQGGWQPIPWLSDSAKQKIFDGIDRRDGWIGDEEVEWPHPSRGAVALKQEGIDLGEITDGLEESQKAVSQGPDVEQGGAPASTTANGSPVSDEQSTDSVVNSEHGGETASAVITGQASAESVECQTQAAVVQVSSDVFLLRPEDLPADLDHGDTVSLEISTDDQDGK